MEDRELFRPVPRETATTRVMEQIYSLLQEGRLQPGQALPGERQLAGKLGVSRNVVREALRALASLGILAIRQGKGTRVAEATQTPLPLSLWVPWLQRNRQAVIDLLGVRESLEMMAARLAAHQATAEGLALLEAICDQMAIAAELQQVGDLVRLDMEFHASLAALSGNQFLPGLNRSIAGALVADRRAVFSLPGRAANSAQEHRKILGCLLQRDPEAAVAAMREHVQSACADIIAAITPQG